MKKQIYSIVVAVAFAVPALASADVEVEKVEENKVVVSYNPGKVEENKVVVSYNPGKVEENKVVVSYNPGKVEENKVVVSYNPGKVEENKVVVSYNPEEVSTTLGRVELERQIRAAAAEVCGPQRVGKAGSLAEFVNNRACFKEALTKALLKV
jgi:UrcA family protein